MPSFPDSAQTGTVAVACSVATCHVQRNLLLLTWLYRFRILVYVCLKLAIVGAYQCYFFADFHSSDCLQSSSELKLPNASAVRLPPQLASGY